MGVQKKKLKKKKINIYYKYYKMNIKIIVIYKKYQKHFIKEDYLNILYILIFLNIKKMELLMKKKLKVLGNQLYINMANLLLNLKMMNLIKIYLIN